VLDIKSLLESEKDVLSGGRFTCQVLTLKSWPTLSAKPELRPEQAPDILTIPES
jgi:hypothetical protein